MGSARQIFLSKEAVFASHLHVSVTDLQGELKKESTVQISNTIICGKKVSLIFSLEVSTKISSHSAAVQSSRGKEIIVYYDNDLFKFSVMLKGMKSL